VRTGRLLLLAAALLCACGRRAPPPPTGPVLEFRIVRRAPRADEGEARRRTDEELRSEVVHVLGRRMRALFGGGSRVDPEGRDRVVVRLEEGADAAEAEDVAVRDAALEFRLLVEEPGRGAEDLAASLWAGTAEEWRRYREEEVAEWRKARDQALPYEPTKDPRYRVVKRADREGGSPDDFVVVVEPQSARERFGGEILSNVRPTTDERGMPAVSFDVQAEHQAAFGDWTGKHVRHPLAILVGGEFRQAPILQSRITDRVQITLGGADLNPQDRAALRARQRTFVVMLATGPLPVVLERVETAGGRPR
jgi:preprotein translocase subunit SecD